MEAILNILPPGLSGDLEAIGIRWLAAVNRHRRDLRVYGKVSCSLVERPEGPQLYLTEETTFKPGDRCPLEAALAWVQVQAARRREHGQTGSFHIETTDKAGVITFARVVETTIISRDGIDTHRATA